MRIIENSETKSPKFYGVFRRRLVWIKGKKYPPYLILEFFMFQA